MMTSFYMDSAYNNWSTNVNQCWTAIGYSQIPAKWAGAAKTVYNYMGGRGGEYIFKKKKKSNNKITKIIPCPDWNRFTTLHRILRMFLRDTSLVSDRITCNAGGKNSYSSPLH